MDKKRIIFCRFGSLQEFRFIKMSVRKISARLFIPKSTVQSFLGRFRNFGFSSQRQNVRFNKINERVQKELIDPKTLKNWAPYNLKERCHLIDLCYGIKIGATQLRRFYKYSKIHYQSAKKVYEQSMTKKKELDLNRRAFSTLLTHIVINQKRLCYIDETTFNSQIVLKKSWALKGVPNQHEMTKMRYSLTVFGAIGNCLQKPFYFIAQTTNKENFQTFLQKLGGKLIPGNKPYLLYDGHRAHTSAINNIQTSFVPLPQPGYSSNFNSIETVWGLAKHLYQKKALVKGGKFDKEVFQSLVLESLHFYDDRMFQILRVNRKYLLNFLD